MKEISNMSQKCIDALTPEVIEDLKKYISFIEELQYHCSKRTHYDKINEWSTQAYSYVHLMLTKFDFKNGVKAQNKNAEFWYTVYQLISYVTYSPNLDTEVSRQDSSAFERNSALLIDLNLILTHK